MLKKLLKDLQRQINKMKVKGIENLENANLEDLRNYILLFKQLDVARYYEKEILNIKHKYEDFLEAEKVMHEWYDKQIKELESEFDRSSGERLFERKFEHNYKESSNHPNLEKNIKKEIDKEIQTKARDYILVNLRESEKEVWELYTDGHTVQKIANKLNKHKQSISATIINIKNKIEKKQISLKNIDSKK